MKIDMNRLHDVILGKRNEEQCGKTVAMIITALGYADFETPIVYIYCETQQNLHTVKEKFIEILTSMEFTWEIKEKTKILVEKTIYEFKLNPDIYTEDKICFFDNYCFITEKTLDNKINRKFGNEIY